MVRKSAAENSPGDESKLLSTAALWWNGSVEVEVRFNRTKCEDQSLPNAEP